MRFNKHYYGDENPSPLRKKLIHVTYVILFFSFYGAWADFVPSEGTYLFARYVAIAAGGLATLWVYLFWFKNGLQLRYKKAGLILKATPIISLPFFFIFVFWLVSAQGIPGIFTRLAGESHSELVDMEKDEHSSRRSCDYRLIGDVMERAFPGYICVKEDYFYNSHDNVRVKLSGVRTNLGFYIVSVYGFPFSPNR